MKIREKSSSFGKIRSHGLSIMRCDLDHTAPFKNRDVVSFAMAATTIMRGRNVEGKLFGRKHVFDAKMGKPLSPPQAVENPPFKSAVLLISITGSRSVVIHYKLSNAFLYMQRCLL